jgi:iron(III) transport system ATP-binding protein
MVDQGRDRTDLYLSVEKVTKHFGRFVALKDISFKAERGEFLCILGPSGCGKTTILRIVAGLEVQTSGSVFVRGQNISSLPVSKRQMGIVFQSYALFPNLTADRKSVV